MRSAKVFLVALLLCLVVPGLAHSQTFTPPNPPATYGPGNFTDAAYTRLGVLGTTVFYKCTQSGITFTALATSTPAQIQLRAAYTMATQQFAFDCGPNFNAITNTAFTLAAVNWFVINVNPLWGY
jgi:hypothetical protein